MAPIKGFKHTKEQIEKMKGRTPWNKNMKGWTKGTTAGFQKGHKVFSEKGRFTTDRVQGERNINWKGGVSKENKTERQLIMETRKYQDWRTSVFLRDNWTCQNCGQRGKRLRAHHDKPWNSHPELRFELNNGVTLCIDCHKEVHRILGY